MFNLSVATRKLCLLWVVAFTSAHIAKADLFDVRFTNFGGAQVGSGQFSTNGICTLCVTPTDVTDYTFTISGITFDDTDILSVLTYRRSSNSFAGSFLFDVSTLGFLAPLDDVNFVFASPAIVGRYSITPASTTAAVPEPASMILLGTVCALVGARLRKRFLT